MAKEPRLISSCIKFITDRRSARPPLKLKTIHEVPDHLKNEGVLGSYRGSLSTSACFWSAFRIHNETVNIWSSFVSAILFCILYGHFWSAGRFELFSFSDSVCTFVPAMCAVMTCLGSCLYHVFIDHKNLKVFRTMRSLDWIFIFLMLLTFAMNQVQFRFKKYPIYQAVNMAFLSFLFVYGSYMFVVKRAYEHYTSYGPLMAAPVVCLNVNLIFSAFMDPSLDNILLITYLFGLQAAVVVEMVVIFITRFPECWKPGAFDIIGHSHQLHHLFGYINMALTSYVVILTADYHIL